MNLWVDNSHDNSVDFKKDNLRIDEPTNIKSTYIYQGENNGPSVETKILGMLPNNRGNAHNRHECQGN